MYLSTEQQVRFILLKESKQGREIKEFVYSCISSPSGIVHDFASQHF